MKIPEKLQKIMPYDPSEDIYPIKLDANESFFQLPAALRERIANAVRELPYNRYPDPAVKKVNALAAAEFGVKAEEIAAGNGSDELISILLNGFCPKGSRLLVLEPDFSMYRLYGEIYEISVLSAEKETDFTVSPEKVIEFCKAEKPAAVIFSNPCNPTGQGFTKGEILHMVESLPDTLLIIDEAYMDFWHESILDCVTQLENVFVLKTMSKAFGMASVRLGFAIANAALIQQVNKIRSPFNVNMLTQTAAEIALQDTTWVKAQLVEILQRKEELEQALEKISTQYPVVDVKKTVTNFVVLQTKYGDKIYQKLLQRGVCIRNFAQYGFLRITAGSREENQRFLSELTAVLEEGF